MIPINGPRLTPLSTTQQQAQPQRSFFNSVDVNAPEHTGSTFEPFTVHSANRDTTQYPNSNDYKIKLSDLCGPLKHVKSIQLVGGTIPDQSTLAQQPYLLLYINELGGGHINSTDDNMQRAYAVLQPDRALEQGYFVQLKADWFAFSKVAVNGQINQLSISIRAADGTLFPFDNNTDHNLFFMIERTCAHEFK